MLQVFSYDILVSWYRDIVRPLQKDMRESQSVKKSILSMQLNCQYFLLKSHITVDKQWQNIISKLREVF